MRVLEVYAEDKTFRITIPDDSKVTFGPWSPPGSKERAYSEVRNTGTLRVYRNHKEQDQLFVRSRVIGFRDLSIELEEEFVELKGQRVWHSDNKGYRVEESVEKDNRWARRELE